MLGDCATWSRDVLCSMLAGCLLASLSECALPFFAVVHLLCLIGDLMMLIERISVQAALSDFWKQLFPNKV